MWQSGINFFVGRERTPREDAARVVLGWLQGRRLHRDEIDRALASAVTDGLDRAAPRASAARRGRAAVTLKEWLAASPHLPQDLAAAVRVLMPEIGQLSLADLDAWETGLDAHPDRD